MYNSARLGSHLLWWAQCWCLVGGSLMTADQVLEKFRLEHRSKCLRALQQLHCAFLTAPSLHPWPRQEYADNGPGIQAAFALFTPNFFLPAHLLPSILPPCAAACC